MLMPAACRSPNFEVSNLTITPAQAVVQETVVVAVEVANIGNRSGDYNLAVKVDGEEYLNQVVTLAAGASETRSFNVIFREVGTHHIEIGGLQRDIEVISLEAAWNEVKENMSNIKSFHFAQGLTVSGPSSIVFSIWDILEEEITTTYNIVLEGDFLLPDRFKGTMEFFAPPLFTSSEMVIIGNDLYEQVPDGTWRKSVMGAEELSSIYPTRVLEIVSEIEDLKWRGMEEIEGIKCSIIEGSVRPMVALPLLEGEFLGKIRVWFGQEDRMIHRITIESSYAEEQPTDVYLEAVFTDFDQEITIEPPAVSSS
jgi:hypothetical protein